MNETTNATQVALTPGDRDIIRFKNRAGSIIEMLKHGRVSVLTLAQARTISKGLRKAGMVVSA